MTTVALVPARGGSKGVPGKNVAEVGGRPMIAWTIAAAFDSGVVDRVVVSTDDDGIATVAEATGAEVPFRRPAALATDEADSVDVALDALDRLGSDPEWLVLLQPTSPLRCGTDVAAAMALATADVDAVVAVRAVREHPAWLVAVDRAGSITPWQPASGRRRQEEPALFVPNGSIYAVRPEVLRATLRWYGERAVAYIMPEERSVDVDTAWDLHIVSLVLGSPATPPSP